MNSNNIHILVGKMQTFVKSFAIIIPCFFASCASNPLSEVSNIPQAFEIAVENTKGENYPKLVDIPNVPNNLMTKDDWNKEKEILVNSHKNLLNNKKSIAPTKKELDSDWAIKTRDDLLRDPRSYDAPKMEDALLWAARMRAILDNQFTQKTQ